jgi:uncharacterized protein YbjT (DUF2867 family)
MRRVLVTGATGVLGSQVVRLATDAGFAVRRMSRRARPDGLNVDWAQADLLTDEGIEAAVDGVEVIVHCASSPFRQAMEVERDGTARLLATAAQCGVAHVIYVSIVNIDQIEFGYYKAKLAGEALISAGAIPFTIVRFTQFHSFVQIGLQLLAKGSFQFLPSGWRFQTIAPSEAAGKLVDLALGPAQGRVPDVGGPEIKTLDDMAASWAAITGTRRRIIHLPVPGDLSHAFRDGRNLAPGQNTGVVTWESWVLENFAPLKSSKVTIPGSAGLFQSPNEPKIRQRMVSE